MARVRSGKVTLRAKRHYRNSSNDAPAHDIGSGENVITLLKDGLRSRFSIRWGDCDPAGIVYYPRYFEMFNNHMSDMIAAKTDLSQLDIKKKYGAEGWPILSTQVDFRLPGAFGATVHIETRVTRFGSSSFDVRHIILQADGAVVAECSETRVWAGRDPD